MLPEAQVGSFVNFLITLAVSSPDILTTAIPEIPGPDESAKIVIIDKSYKIYLKYKILFQDIKHFR